VDRGFQRGLLPCQELVGPRRRTLDEIMKHMVLRAFIKAGDKEIPQEKINAAFREASEAASQHMAEALREEKRSCSSTTPRSSAMAAHASKPLGQLSRAATVGAVFE